MKYFLIAIYCLIVNMTFGQNGIFSSNRFEFISQNEPSLNREDYTPKKLIININELHDEFINGRILWELFEENGQSVYLEYELLSLKNSSFDNTSNSFIKCHKTNVKVSNIIMDHVDLYIIKNVSTNALRIDVFDPIKLTIHRFERFAKL